MRELTVQEMGQASGGVVPIVPIIGLTVSLIGMAARRKAVQRAAEIAGLLLAGHGLVKSQEE